MLSKRIIPCLDIRDGVVVKGVNFDNIKEIADPVELAKYYNKTGADELVFYDISAAIEQRSIFLTLLREVAKEVFIPLCVGGNITTLADIEAVLANGADKVSINSGALKNPNLINEAAKKYGNQCIVASVDIKRTALGFEVFSAGGRIATGIEALGWIVELEKRGAGEVVVNSIDTDGVRGGFDLPLLEAISALITIPIIASGGAGNAEHFITLFESNPKVDGGLAASIFHLKELPIPELKQALAAKNIRVRSSGYDKV
ncbi:imidazole glycerol phosphate synthase catalytic subunit [Erysipelotrichaceae bacterium]|nr:imidazole glycerol phosphate synthase catalytic subunit [Erysipelotrichaceae bacterium]